MKFKKYVFFEKVLISALFLTLNACDNSFLKTRLFTNNKLNEQIESNLLSKHKYLFYYTSIIYLISAFFKYVI